MQTMTQNTIVVTLAAFLTLTAGAYAQMGPMKGTPHKGGVMGGGMMGM